jgi:hypothetical protein
MSVLGIALNCHICLLNNIWTILSPPTASGCGYAPSYAIARARLCFIALRFINQVNVIPLKQSRVLLQLSSHLPNRVDS